MKTFREQYEKKILKESPFRVGLYLPERPDYWASNIEWTKDIIKDNKLIGIFNDAIGVPHNIYYNFAQDLHEYYFVFNQTHLAAYVFFREEKYGYVAVDMWKYIKSPMKMDYIFLNYFILKLYRILSDENLTDQGEAFWKNLIKNNISNNKLRFGIYNNETNSMSYYGFKDDEIWENTKYQVFVEKA